MLRSVRAGPEGARRPCSHSWRVLTDTPSSRANSACERPVRARISAIGGSVITRPTLPRLSCRSPSRISWPTLRGRLLIFDLLANPAQQMAGNDLRDVLCVNRQHPDDAWLMADEID